MNKSDFINRELSWLAFNERVLTEAADESNPLMERVKFAAIFSSNMDEFFMVRAAGIKEQISYGYGKADPSGLTPKAQLKAIHKKASELVLLQEDIFDSLNSSYKNFSAEILANNPPIIS